MTPITVYSTNPCNGCDATKRFLAKKGADFKVIDITDNDTAREEVLEIMGQQGIQNRQMPLVIAGNGTWNGFNFEKLSTALTS